VFKLNNICSRGVIIGYMAFRLRYLSRFSFGLTVMLVGCAVTPPVIQQQPGYRTLVVMCPISVSTGDRPLVSKKPSSFSADGPIRFVVNSHDTFRVPSAKTLASMAYGNFLAWRLEVSAPLSQAICVQYTTVFTRRSVINTKHPVDTTVCFAPSDTLPRFVVFSSRFPRGFFGKPFLASPVMFTDVELDHVFNRKLYRRWQEIQVEKLRLL